MGDPDAVNVLRCRIKSSKQVVVILQNGRLEIDVRNLSEVRSRSKVGPETIGSGVLPGLVKPIDMWTGEVVKIALKRCNFGSTEALGRSFLVQESVWKMHEQTLQIDAHFAAFPKAGTEPVERLLGDGETIGRCCREHQTHDPERLKERAVVLEIRTEGVECKLMVIDVDERRELPIPFREKLRKSLREITGVQDVAGPEHSRRK